MLLLVLLTEMLPLMPMLLLMLLVLGASVDEAVLPLSGTLILMLLHCRALALTTLASVGAVWAFSRPLPLHPAAKLLMTSVAAVTVLQV